MLAILWPALGALTLTTSTTSPAVRVSPQPRMQFGGNPFEGLKNPFADKASGATTVALTIGFNCMERGPRSVLGQLDALAANADTSNADGIAQLCGDAALAVLRRSGEWVSCSGSVEHKGDDDAALNIFDRLAIREAAKFEDRDPSKTIDAALAAAGVGASASSGQPTLAIVCLIACLMGDREEEIGAKDFQGDAGALRAGLSELAAAANGDEEVFAFELLWVPGGDDEVLDSDEVMLDWPELMPC